MYFMVSHRHRQYVREKWSLFEIWRQEADDDEAPNKQEPGPKNSETTVPADSEEPNIDGGVSLQPKSPGKSDLPKSNSKDRLPPADDSQEPNADKEKASAWA